MRQINDVVARRMAVAAQQLAAEQMTADGPAIMSVLRRLGCLQLDPINTVARSPLLVLWSRLGTYDLADFEKLLWEDKTLFEYWAHAASIVLTEDFPLYLPRMRGFAQGQKRWEKKVRAWMKANERLRQSIMRQLADNGPVLADDLATVPDVVPWQSSGWTESRNISVMLTFLWDRGEIMVARRRGNGFGLKKEWVLTEQHLPRWAHCEPWSERAVVKTAVQKSLRALGLGTAAHIKNHFIRGRYPGLARVLSDLEKEESIVPLEVIRAGQPLPGNWYVHREDLPLLDQLESGNWEPRTTLLSPFDNLICDRDRTETLFDFVYRSEIYTPKARRQYGYYVMPVLHGDRLVGRIDPQLSRKTKQLLVHQIHWEPATASTPGLLAAVEGAIASLADFLGAAEVVYP